MYENLTKWLETLPQLEGQRFNFDFTSDTPTNYAVVIPTNIPELSEDIVGIGTKQLVFYIRAVKPWGEDVANNIDNITWFSNLKSEIKKRNKDKDLPILDENKTTTKVELTTEGYINATAGQVGTYQIQGRVLYKEPEVETIGTKITLPHTW